MAIETPSENWTKFPNYILDNLTQFTGNELKILALITKENSNGNYEFSLSFIVKKTGITKSTVFSAIQELLGQGIITELESGERGVKRYATNL
jgi:DNA-binding MarR family transcriptional regulator